MRTRMRYAVPAAAALLLAGCAAAPGHADLPRLKEQVAETERQFAASMAARDFAAFSSFLSEDAVFFNGKEALHGKQEVAARWKRFFEKPGAPFSWQPDQVEILGSGDLALSTGPVLDPDGKLIGRFNSIWRLEAPGTWRIVFDKGNEVCD